MRPQAPSRGGDEGAAPAKRASDARAAGNLLDELVGGGRSVKHVKDCTELSLAGRGIEWLQGFDQLFNLEVLWLNGNALRYVTGLDANVRLRELYLHDNRLCTLKGSLQHLKFLTHLDLGANALRDLPKLLARLQKLLCLRQLNLKGNPCCEEPDYRLLVIHRMPWLEVLDFHPVTRAERRRALEVVGGGTAALSVAFGRRAAADGAWRERAPEMSVLELELVQAATRVREARLAAAEQAEADAYTRNPDAGFWAPKASLPPPPGWAAAAASAGALPQEGAAQAATGAAVPAPAPAASRREIAVERRQEAAAGQGSRAAAAAAPGRHTYVARDVLVLHRHLAGAVTVPMAGQPAGGAVTIARSTFAPSWALSSVTLKV